MKFFPRWFFYHVDIKVDFRLKWWKKLSAIWLGTEIRVGDAYGHKSCGWEADLTVCNVGIKVAVYPTTAQSIAGGAMASGSRAIAVWRLGHCEKKTAKYKT